MNTTGEPVFVLEGETEEKVEVNRLFSQLLLIVAAGDAEEAPLNLLNVKGRKRDRFPEVASIFARHSKVLVPFLFDDRVVLNRQSVPHNLIAALQSVENNQIRFRNGEFSRSCVCFNAVR